MASTTIGQRGDKEARERRRDKGRAVRRPRQELAGAWRRRTGAGEGRIRRDGAESLNIQTRRISFFILLVLFVQRKEKRKAATPPAGWVTATRPRVVQPLLRVRMRTYHQVIHSSPLFSYFPWIWSSFAMFFSCRNHSFSMLLSRSEAQSLEILCSALSDISSD